MTAGATLPVVHVVVHPDGALVTRAGPLPVADGRVVVRQLPLVLDPTSLRATVVGVAVAELRAEIELLDDDGVEAPRRIEELRAAREELAAVDAEIEASGELRETLSGLAPGFDDDDDARRALPTPERLTAWLAADRAVGLRVEALDETVRALAARRRDVAERIERLSLEVARASTEERWARWVPTRRVVLRTEGARAGSPAQVELSYRVPGARWSPAYVLDADDALRNGRFAMRASVRQATGEDWRGVRLTLASGPCERRIDVPELAALRLGTRQPARATGWRPLPTDLDGLFPDVPLAAPPPPARPEPPRERAVDDDIDLELSPEADEDDLSASLEPVPATPAPAPRRSAPAAAPQAPAPVAMPAARLEEAPRSRSMGNMVSSLVDAAAAAMPKGSAERSRIAPGAPVDRRQGKRDGAGGGGRGPRPEEPDAGFDVDVDWLDYGRMRLAPWSAPRGERGRLRPASDEDVLTERGAPPTARARLGARLLEARREVHDATEGPLPPHHVVPGPVWGTDVRIDARGEVDVPADGLPHSVAVDAWPADLDVAYRAVPRSDPRAFRRVTARIQYDRALLPGPVDVYVEGKLELTSPWPGSPGRGVLEIGLGAEDRIKLVRNVRYSEASAGVFGGSRRLHTEIEVKVASSLPRAVSIELLERVPVPADGKDVAVEQTEASPVAEPYQGEPDTPILAGGRRQVLEVAPGAEARAVLAYAVTIGAKEEIVGGDRRG